MINSRTTTTVVLLLSLYVLLPLMVSDYRMFQLTLVVSYAIAILGLNILVGYTGQISLGHGAFYAIGAYTYAIPVDRAGIPYYATVPVAAIICFGFGVLMGFPALRLRGHYLALATYGLALAVPQFLRFHAIEDWTGGVQGLVLNKPEAPFQLSSVIGLLTADRWLYYFALTIAVVLFAAASNLVRGRIGRALLAVRDQPVAAAAMGVNLARIKTQAFGLSAAYTGVAGALGAMAVGFVAPDGFTAFLSITLFVGVVVGGLASIQASMIGALFVQFVPNIASGISQSAPWAIYGVFLFVFMYFAPNGVAGLISAAWNSLAIGRRRPGSLSALFQSRHPKKQMEERT